MKIALLNLPIDNNYGGNLQRYALMKVLQNMGHDVTHINLHTSYDLSFPVLCVKLFKRIIKRILGKPVVLFLEKQKKEKSIVRERFINEFYNKYIKHTIIVFSVSDVKKLDWQKFDAVIVGSDQVWRYDMTRDSLGIDNYFLKFLNKKIKKIAFSISLGNYEESKIPQYRKLKKLYGKFSAVSFREEMGIPYALKVGWNNPKPENTLDPTLLLSAEEYIDSLNLKKNDSSNFIFIYLLDRDEKKSEKVDDILYKFEDIEVLSCGLDEDNVVPIEQWLENIMNSQFVITDSYHGVVFSIIFNKPFYFLGNTRRGNSRIESLFKVLGMKNSECGIFIDWKSINKRKKQLQRSSIKFLRTALFIND